MTQSMEQQPVPYSPSRLSAGNTLIFAPHPDDEVFGCGGAIIRHRQQGDEMKVVIVTDGSFSVNESQNMAESDLY